MTLKQRYRLTFEYFEKYRPVVETELDWTDPFELIVAVILSAQCTDKRVNIITPLLLEKFPDVGSMAMAEPSDIVELIKSCTYPNSKANHLSNGEDVLRILDAVPSEPDLLQRLPAWAGKQQMWWHL
jgi:endonuclease-3